MKGIVFNEFVSMVEGIFGEELMDEIFNESELASGGAYTSVGTYDHTELITLVQKLSDKIKIPTPQLVHGFGKHLAKVFSTRFQIFFEGCNDTFEFLHRIDNHIHVEVKKLYPDAELPRFYYESVDTNQLRLIYESSRAFGDLAEGLIEGCAEYFGEVLQIQKDDQSSTKQHRIVFTITKLVV